MAADTTQSARADILTVRGTYFDFVRPAESAICITSIAHALAHICRFTGHTRWHYSVAQHSVAVSHLVPPAYALHGLLHDAAEAYIGDVAKPLKRLLPDYQVLEKRVEAAVFARFGLPPELPECVKHADLVMLATEKRDLMPKTEDAETAWLSLKGLQPQARPISQMSPTTAGALFLQRYMELVHPAWRSGEMLPPEEC